MNTKELDQLIITEGFYELDDTATFYLHLLKLFKKENSINYCERTVIHNRSTQWLELHHKSFSISLISGRDINNPSILINICDSEKDKERKIIINDKNFSYALAKNGLLLCDEEAPTVRRYHGLFKSY